MTEVLTQPAPSESMGLSMDRAGNRKPMISSAQIARRVHRLGRRISEVYADIDTPLVMVVILKGATVFAADLLRSLSIPAELEFVRASSYPTGTSSNGRRSFAARLLARRRDQLAGSVVFMFQPGEEGYHGARFMLEEGLHDGGTAPSAAFALHGGARRVFGGMGAVVAALAKPLPASRQQQAPVQPQLRRRQESDQRVPAAQYSPLAAQGGYSRGRTSPLEAMVHALNPRDVNLGAMWEERRRAWLENAGANRYFWYSFGATVWPELPTCRSIGSQPSSQIGREAASCWPVQATPVRGKNHV